MTSLYKLRRQTSIFMQRHRVCYTCAFMLGKPPGSFYILHTGDYQ